MTSQTITKIEQYVNRIQDQNKQAFAKAYFTWIATGSIPNNDPDKDTYSLTAKNAISVRSRINQLVK